MYPKLFPIYGPLEINSFNAAIMLGLALFFLAVRAHRDLEKYISKSDFFSISVESAIAGIIGGRLLHVISEWNEYTSFFEMISIWNGGLSVLGALAGVLGYSIWALKQKNIPILPVYDRAALYAPLLHGVARIGCFLAGCCYGSPTTHAWGVIYTHPLVIAPHNIQIHPTQLYSSLLFFGIFIVLWYISTKQTATGELCLLYLIAMSFERWFVDFFRGDRIMLTHPHPLSFFSFYQWVSLLIFTGALTALVYLRSSKQAAAHDV